MKLRTARLVSCRAVSPPFRPRLPEPPSWTGWVATLLGAILLFWDKNLFPQVTDEYRKLSGPLAVVFKNQPREIRHERPDSHRRDGCSGGSQSDIRRNGARRRQAARFCAVYRSNQSWACRAALE